jgi:Yip1 domain
MTPGSNLASQPASAAPEAAPQNFFSRLSGVYFSPGETFQEIGRAPRPVVPILVLAAVTFVGAYLFFNRIGVETVFGQGIEQAVESGRLTPEQAEQQREGIRKIAPYAKYLMPVVFAVFITVMILAIAGLARLVSMVMGIDNKFGPLFGVTLYAFLAVSLVSSVVLLALIYLKPVEEIDMQNPVGSNLAAFAAFAGITLPKFLKFLLSYVDLFYIWKVVLLGIGYAAVSRRVKVSTAVTYTAAVAVVIAFIGAGWAAMFS